MTWLKWCGDKHQEFFDWTFDDEELPLWKRVLRVTAFVLVDSLIWMIIILGAICTFIGLIARFLPNDSEE